MADKPHSTVESRMAGIDEARLAATREEILEPDLPIIDPHHHLWNFPTHRFMLEEMLRETSSGHRIESTVFIECTANYRAEGPEHMRVVGETEFVAAIAEESASGRHGPTRVAAGIVGMADLTLGARVEEVLAAHVEAGRGRFRGIRHAAGWEDKEPSIHNSHTNPPRHLYRDHAGFREGLAVLGRMGLSFDAWLYHPQLGDLVDLARACPEQPIVLNHVGGPLGLGWYAGRRDEVFADWRRDMLALAKCPNVHIKLGGLGMRLNGFEFDKHERAPGSEDLAAAWRPFVETCIEAFGVERCMFESNFPVDKVSGAYPIYWNAFKRLAQGASDDDKAALFRETARRFYRLN